MTKRMPTLWLSLVIKGTSKKDVMDRARKESALRRILGPAYRKGDELVFFCPRKSCRKYVAQEKKKLSVNLKTDIFHCWTCEFKGLDISPLLRFRGENDDYRQYVAERSIVSGQEEKKYEEVVLPPEFVSLSVDSKSFQRAAALDYVYSRGLKFQDVLRYKLGYCEDGEYKNRVVIPSFDQHGALNFFVGRAYYDSMLKYKHGNFSKDIIFNDYLVDWDQSVVLTEGPFDSMKAGQNSIPLQGCRVVSEGSLLFERIVSRGIDVYFAMDADAFRKQIRIIKEFLSYGVSSFYVPMLGKKDPGEMTHDEFLARRSKAFKVSSSFDLLRMRLMKASEI